MTDGWDLLGFEAIEGARHADYSPGSPDVAKVFEMLGWLHGTPYPQAPSMPADRRWGRVLDDPTDAERFAGTSLLHTDWHQFNVLLSDRRAWLIDWAWVTHGAAFIDPALVVPRLVAAGHSPSEAEGWAEKTAAWQEADQASITLFAEAVARQVRNLADKDPAGAWRLPMVNATRRWADYRTGLGS